MQDNTILKLAYDISQMTRDKVGAIESIMTTTKILALNARIEAGRSRIVHRGASRWPSSCRSQPPTCR